MADQSSEQAKIEQKREHNRRYYAAHKEQIAASNRARYQADREQRRAKQRVYYFAHRDQILAQHLVYNAKHDCECGGHYTTVNRCQHRRTEKHQRWAADQRVETPGQP